MASFAEEIIVAAKSSNNSLLQSQAGGDSLLQLVDKLDGCGEAEIFKDFQGKCSNRDPVCLLMGVKWNALIAFVAAVIEAGIAVDYLHSLLLASPSASVRGKRRRLLCFAKGIKVEGRTLHTQQGRSCVLNNGNCACAGICAATDAQGLYAIQHLFQGAAWHTVV